MAFPKPKLFYKENPSRADEEDTDQPVPESDVEFGEDNNVEEEQEHYISVES